MILTIDKVLSNGGTRLAEVVAKNLGNSDLAEFAALGATGDIKERIQYGFDHTDSYVLSSEEDGKILCVGGVSVEGQSIWLLTTAHMEGMNRKGRIAVAFKLRGMLNELLKEHEGVQFNNVVSMFNNAHIKLIKALGGKGFSTMFENTKTKQMFYPFHFLKEVSDV